MKDGFTFNDVKLFSSLAAEALYLVLINPDKAPPHVALGFGNSYFSLTTNGAEVALPLESRLKLFRLRKMPVLFVVLKSAYNHGTFEILTKAFKSFAPLTENDSCLQPVELALKAIFHLVPEKPLLFGLLEMLASHQLIEETFQLNMEPFMDENFGFHLKSYDSDSVRKTIQRLRNRKRQQGRQ